MLKKFVFFGTPEFAAIILERLIKAGWTPAAVVTNPDRPVDRKQTLKAPPVKFSIFNFQFSIKVFQPEKLLEIKDKLTEMGADFGILAAYGKILPKEIIDIFPKGIIGVHPSLLPKYRGPTPIQSAILNRDEETGVTLFLMDEKIDHGPILINHKSKIKNQNYGDLIKELAEISADLLIEILPKYLAGEIKPQAQDESQATYTKKFTTEDAKVDLEKDQPELVWRKVRALNPEPGVWTLRQAQGKLKRMKILEADLDDGKLILKKIQFAGEKVKII